MYKSTGPGYDAHNAQLRMIGRTLALTTLASLARGALEDDGGPAAVLLLVAAPGGEQKFLVFGGGLNEASS